jgi:hypothetical protein
MRGFAIKLKEDIIGAKNNKSMISQFGIFYIIAL